MANALPGELLARHGTPALSSNGSTSDASPRVIPHALPKDGQTKNTDVAVANCTGPIPCTTGEITDTTTFPNITHGKVFFRDPTIPADFVCSGTVVNAQNESVVWTAGHCVHGGPGGTFARNWMFAPGFRDGNQPEGRWPASNLWVTTAWANNGNFSLDFAAAVLARKSGDTIQERVGARGIAFHMDLEDEAIRAIGHPAAPNPPFNGQRMMFCDSTIEQFDTRNPAPLPMGMGCDMEGGSSGGGWIWDGDTLVSNVSYGYPGEPEFEDVFFGPQFSNVAEGMYNAVSTQEVVPPAITRVSDKPDPFTPNGDGRKDRTRIRFRVNENFSLVFTIKRNGNNVVRIVDFLGPGTYVVTWNGRRNFTGQKVNSGQYTYSIRATDEFGNSATKSGKTTVKR
jgi:hypothetical protein